MELKPPNPKPFRFENPKQERIHRRLSLLGPGPASFFLDACRLMATPWLEATTHLVAHLLREIESALRDVLEPLADERVLQEQRATNEQAKHDAEIHVILQALGIPDTDPVAQAWMQLAGRGEEYGLYARAHRRNLGPSRAVDAEFRKFWRDVQDVFDVVSARFETTYLAYFDILDQLLAKERPTGADVRKLRNSIPNNPATLGYFFDKLMFPQWLQPLREAGFLAHPPEPSPNPEDGTAWHQSWPQTRYLARMARLAPEEVRNVILEVPKTGNPFVHEDFADAALGMPPHIAATLVPSAETWLDAPNLWSLPDKLGQLLAHLANGGEVEAALRLAKTLLAILPDPEPEQQAETEEPFGPTLEPHARFSPWHYERILKENVPPLVEAAGMPALDMLCDLLESALHLSQESADRSPDREDFSYIWRPAIEDDTHNYLAELKNPLISAVRDAGQPLITGGAASARDLVSALQQRGWPIFSRIALHLLRVIPDADPRIIAEQLVNRAHFKELSTRHEYALLLKSQFANLPSGQQAAILAWLTEPPSWTAADAQFRRWQRDWLSPISEHLPPRWQQRYDQLVAELGPANHPESPVYSTPFRVGPTSPVTSAALQSMSIEEIVRFLNEWIPPSRPMDHSAEGLGRALAAAVAADPRRFADAAPQLQTVPEPTYISAIFTGLRDALKDKRTFRWRPVLDLAHWVLAQPREIPGRILGRHDDPDPDWGWTRQCIATLLEQGLLADRARLPMNLRRRVWPLLALLAEDPDPTPEHERKYGGPNWDAAHLSINTVRALAMHSVVRYALCVSQHLEKRANAQELLHHGLDEMPEARAVLDRHLDPDRDPSLAIRAVYGRWFPHLVLLDSAWAKANVTRIFPSDPSQSHLRDAAWETYLAFCPPYGPAYDLLRDEYTRAAQRVGYNRGDRRVLTDPDERLGEHLMVLYWWGKLSLAELDPFFLRAPAQLRGHALSYVGRSLCSDPESLSPEGSALLRELWEWRRTEAAPATKADARAELSAFGWWFTSKKFPEDWALQELTAVLGLTRWAEPYDAVLEHLAALAPQEAGLAVSLLAKMVEGDHDGWAIRRGWRKAPRSILETALRSADQSARQAAEQLINRLGALGFLQYRDLLNHRGA